MSKFLNSIRNLQFSGWTVPFALLAACILSFGLLIPWLGFYQDDWHALYYAQARGVSSLWELYFYDNRPLSAWPYQLVFPILGFQPLHWHIFLLIVRWLTAVTMWSVFRALWPGQARPVAWAALLFTVYPLFKLQPLAVAYTQHWVSYGLFSISLLAMIQSIRKPRWFWPLTGLSLLTALLHLITVEYFSGVELIRPLLIFFLLPPESGTLPRRIRAALRRWLPYLLLLAAFFAWRVFWMPTPGYDNNSPVLLFDLLSAPLTTSIRLALVALQDFVAIVSASWAQTLEPALFEIDEPSDVASLALILISAAGLFFYLARLDPSQAELEARPRPWFREALIVGGVATLLGPVPAWLTGQSISGQNPLWSDRLGLAAMFGASLFVVGLLEMFLHQPGHRVAILCALVGLAIGWHFRSTNEFRWAWSQQRSFYQQLAWRAPSIEPGTAILSDDEIFDRMGDYPTAFAINSLYPQSGDPQALGYWFYVLNQNLDDKIEEIRQGTQLRARKFSARFSGSSRDSLVILFETDQDHCLWVLGPEDGEIRALPEITREVLGSSNLERIQRDPPPVSPLPAAIFSQDPEPAWCYFYEKADLARQFEDWEQVQDLWQAASSRGLRPQNGVEFLPFIEAFARTGEWEPALELTTQSKEGTRAVIPALCAVWGRIEARTASSLERDSALGAARQLLACQN
jgi:hypothetical protein